MPRDYQAEKDTDMAARLTLEERKEIVLISGERSTRVIAADFNTRHPNRPPIRHGTVGKLLTKFRQTGSVLDLPKSGRNKTATDEATTMAVLASFSKSPHRSTRRLSQESGVSRTAIGRILATHKSQLLERQNQSSSPARMHGNMAETHKR